MNVDTLLPQKTPVQKQAEAEKAKSDTAKTAPVSDEEMEKSVNGPIVTMKKNPVARGLDFTGRVSMKKITVNKAEISNFEAEMTFKDMVMNLKKASGNAFSGSMNYTTMVDFRGQDPVYQVGGDVNGLDVNAAVSNQMPSMKDSVFGKAVAKFSINGSGVTKPKVKNSLKGQGNFKLENGTWSALKVLQTVGEKLKSIPQAQDKLGGVKISGKFRQLKSDFSIAGGQFNIVNMVADMEEANTGLNGNGFVDFDMNTKILGKIFAPAGGDVPAELKQSDGRLSLPYEIGCQVMNPCLKMDQAVQVVAKAYLKKEGGAAVKKALENVEAPQQVKDLIKKLPF